MLRRTVRRSGRLLLIEALVALSLAGVAQADHRDLAPAEDTGPKPTSCNNVSSPDGSIVIRRAPDGPRQPNGQIAFRSGVCIYLPPNYETSGLRYPVLYLLHGAFAPEGQGDWTQQGSAQAVLDDFYAENPDDAVIVVMPDGTTDANWDDTQNGTRQNETYVLRHVIPYVDDHFRTIPVREARAIDGLSNGGRGAMRLAAKAPDLFVTAGEMSGAFLGPQPEQGYTAGQHPFNLAENLDNIDITMVWGATCDPARSSPPCSSWAFENLPIIGAGNRLFKERLELIDHRGALEYLEEPGGHDWPSWNLWLREYHLPFLLPRMTDPQPTGAPFPETPLPEVFRYRSVSDSFSVWGYDVAVDRPAIEFLDLVDVRQEGFTVQGDGQVVIDTAPRYAPGTYDVTVDDSPPLEIASEEGRLEIPVDLADGLPGAASRTVQIEGPFDRTAPVTTAQLTPRPDKKGVYRNPTVTLTASDDASGIERTEYRLDGGGWTTYEAPFVVTGKGRHVLEYRSVDGAGNVEETKSLTFKVK